jgi:hypothetical protein
LILNNNWLTKYDSVRLTAAALRRPEPPPTNLLECRRPAYSVRAGIWDADDPPLPPPAGVVELLDFIRPERAVVDAHVVDAARILGSKNRLSIRSKAPIVIQLAESAVPSSVVGPATSAPSTYSDHVVATRQIAHPASLAVNLGREKELDYLLSRFGWRAGQLCSHEALSGTAPVTQRRNRRCGQGRSCNV